MEDLAQKILEEEKLRLQQQHARADEQAEVQHYTRSVVGEFCEVVRAIENSIIETNRKLPVNLQIYTGRLNDLEHSFLVVRGGRFISIRLESINVDGWIGLCFSNGYCDLGISSNGGAFQVNLHDKPYQVLLWAKYFDEGVDSIFRWNFSSPLACQHPVDLLAPYDVRCGNCGRFATGSFTNQQLAENCLLEFGKTNVPLFSTSRASKYLHLPQKCRFRRRPLEEPCVGP